MDVAHNPPAIDVLIRTAQVVYPDHEIHAICGFSKNKDIKSIFEQLIPHCARLYLISPHHSRAQAFEAVVQARDEFKNTHPEIVNETQFAAPIEGGNIGETIKSALGYINTNKSKAIVVYCGSFYVMEEARAFLEIPDIKDPAGINE